MKIWSPLFESKYKFSEKLGNSYSYHCIQLNLGPSDYFNYFQSHISDGDLYHSLEKKEDGSVYDKYGRENEPHITLCYGLKNEKDYDSIQKLFSLLKPFPIYLGKTSFFRDDSKPYSVRICEIDDGTNWLHKLNSIIRSEYDVYVSYPTYTPHITIAYCKPDFGIRDGGRHKFEGKEIIADKFIWSHTDGRKLPLILEK